MAPDESLQPRELDLRSPRPDNCYLPETFIPAQAKPGDLLFNPRTGRTHEVLDGYGWRDVSLAFPVDDITDVRIRWENMNRGQSNYMPKPIVWALLDDTQDITFEEVPNERLPE